MAKMVHVWDVKCSSCGTDFLHEFRASDIFRPHMFADLYFKCPSCGKKGFDHVTPQGKMTLEEWQQKHPDMSVSDIVEYPDEKPQD